MVSVEQNVNSAIKLDTVSILLVSTVLDSLKEDQALKHDKIIFFIEVGPILKINLNMFEIISL